MGKVWVLDTETKGTGATIVPLDKTPKEQRDRPVEPWFAMRHVEPARPEPAQEPTERPTRRFKVVDVVSREVLAEGADGRATVDVLKGLRSVVDVRLSVWDDDAQDWRLLSLGEQKAIWALRDR
jgi:hypothetical protein